MRKAETMDHPIKTRKMSGVVMATSMGVPAPGVDLGLLPSAVVSTIPDKPGLASYKETPLATVCIELIGEPDDVYGHPLC